MLRSISLLRFTCLLTLPLTCALLIGCGDTGATGGDADTQEEKTGAEGKDMSAGDAEADDIEAALAQLSDEDRVLAEAQEICPVGGGKLGFMGTPAKVDVDGTPVFLCCSGCEEELLANKEKYLTLLADRKAEEK